MKPFKSLLQFQKHFDTDEKCRLYLEQQRWGSTPACPFCGSINICRFASDNKTFKCREKQCRKKFTATVGTIYENTKIPLTKWFLATYILAVHSKGISAFQLADFVDVTVKTAWFLNHRIREMLKDKEPKLSGMVEADETYIGGKITNKHVSIRKQIKNASSLVHKTPVMGLLQRGGKLITFVVKDADRRTVLPLIINKIEPGSLLSTDSSHLYTPLNKFYLHGSVNHTKNEYVKGIIHTNGIEGYWSQLKRQINGIHHHVSAKHLQRYCNESSYRYNNRTLTQDEKFADAISKCEGRLKYQDLIAK